MTPLFAGLGGFFLPFARRLPELAGKIPEFDFALPGVTSISADTHKYGYATKGTSVVLYRNAALRRHQFFFFPRWSGGIYITPSTAGTYTCLITLLTSLRSFVRSFRNIDCAYTINIGCATPPPGRATSMAGDGATLAVSSRTHTLSRSLSLAWGSPHSFLI